MPRIGGTLNRSRRTLKDAEKSLLLRVKTITVTKSVSIKKSIHHKSVLLSRSCTLIVSHVHSDVKYSVCNVFMCHLGLFFISPEDEEGLE